MKQVLIIDDSTPIRERVAELLSKSPQVLIAGQVGSGREALAAVEYLRPDVAIVDIRLPDMSGIALLKIFKARFPAMRVIMLTNLDDDRYRSQCLYLGADHYLNKTMEFEKIIDTVIGGTDA